MTTYTCVIVGARFRGPEAVGILAVLGVNNILLLRRERENKYDKNAIMVLVEAAELAQLGEEAQERLTGYGVTLAEVLARLGEEPMHLGYVPATDAAIIAPRMDAGGCSEVCGEVSFDSRGKAVVRFAV